MKIVDITPENAGDHAFFCIRNTREPGFLAKADWFMEMHRKGLRLKVAYAEDGRQVGFIEYVPAEEAWRPVVAGGWMFIHCIMVYPGKYRRSGVAGKLIEEALSEAREAGMLGVCTMTSEGPWIATRKLFEKQGFYPTDSKGRFELMALEITQNAGQPKFLDWEARLKEFKGWHLLYADQCPWHAKGVKALIDSARDLDITLQVTKISSPEEAKHMPSGFGVFALVKDGKLLEDHYISKRRFETIVERESRRFP